MFRYDVLCNHQLDRGFLSYAPLQDRGTQLIGWFLGAAGGAAGALARYGINLLMIRTIDSSLAGTFAANISGSLLLGLFIGFTQERSNIPEDYQLLLAVGFLGSYTTFSTLTLVSTQLFEEGDILRASVNLFGSIFVGLLAALVGLAIGRAL